MITDNVHVAQDLVAAGPQVAPSFDRTGDRSSAGLVRMAVIGYGYWGPNIVRNLHGLECRGAGHGVRQERRGPAARRRARIRACT